MTKEHFLHIKGMPPFNSIELFEIPNSILIHVPLFLFVICNEDAERFLPFYFSVIQTTQHVCRHTSRYITRTVHPFPPFLFFPGHYPGRKCPKLQKRTPHYTLKNHLTPFQSFVQRATQPKTSFLERRAHLSPQHANHLGYGASEHYPCNTPRLCDACHLYVLQVRSANCATSCISQLSPHVRND